MVTKKKIPAPPAGPNQLQHHLETRLGLGPNDAARLAQVVADCLLDALVNPSGDPAAPEAAVNLGPLGSLRACVSSDGTKLNWVKLYYPGWLSQAIRDGLADPTRYRPAPPAKGLGAEATSATLRRADRRLKASFASYLRDGFVLGHSWQHPTTQKAYEAERITKCIELYRVLAPKNWLLFWLLWWPISERVEFIADQLDGNMFLIKQAWNHAIDSVLLLLTCEHLTPSGARALLEPKLENK